VIIIFIPLLYTEEDTVLSKRSFFIGLLNYYIRMLDDIKCQNLRNEKVLFIY